MDFGQRLAVHLPGQYHFVDLHLSPWHRNNVIEDMALLEIGVHACELDMFCAVFQTAAILDDFFQTDSCPFRRTNSSFAPLP